MVLTLEGDDKGQMLICDKLLISEGGSNSAFECFLTWFIE